MKSILIKDTEGLPIWDINIVDKRVWDLEICIFIIGETYGRVGSYPFLLLGLEGFTLTLHALLMFSIISAVPIYWEVQWPLPPKRCSNVFWILQGCNLMQLGSQHSMSSWFYTRAPAGLCCLSADCKAHSGPSRGTCPCRTWLVFHHHSILFQIANIHKRLVR